MKRALGQAFFLLLAFAVPQARAADCPAKVKEKVILAWNEVMDNEPAGPIASVEKLILLSRKGSLATFSAEGFRNDNLIVGAKAAVVVETTSCKIRRLSISVPW